MVLINAINEAGVAGATSFLDDERGRISLLALGCQAGAQAVTAFRDKVVVLALAQQRETLAALIQLDGIARRIILWPPDRSDDQIASIIERAGVDVIIRDWPVEREMPDTVRSDLGPVATRERATEWVLFTSGTTGLPKMVVHTLHSLAGHISPNTSDRPRPVWCTFYDVRRYGGLQIALRALIGGCSLVLAGKGESTAAFLARARVAGASHFLGTPSHWRLALMAKAQSIIAPAYVRLSGEVADQTILDLLTSAFPQAALVHAFAATEAGLAFEVTDRRAGFPLSFLVAPGFGVTVRIVDGTLHVRSERGCKGLLDGKIIPLANAEGYIDTGDAVALHHDRLYFSGRRDGVVNVGGQKVFPEEVEAVINRHPAVGMSRVSARRNSLMGTIVTAEVVPLDGGVYPCVDLLPDDIIRFCRTSLPPHKVPAIIRIVAALDVAPSGKLMRARA
jgi:acyl-coenzyme A synthetase/AMP-(fatty) acid ligase